MRELRRSRALETPSGRSPGVLHVQYKNNNKKSKKEKGSGEVDRGVTSVGNRQMAFWVVLDRQRALLYRQGHSTFGVKYVVWLCLNPISMYINNAI
mmetsp:Transcript_16019/g.23927  ORF Transcript_16019/g.23927 Transcript_16019/m.23927 type:complete len:96 (+) Transcript_16019:501-788(+)